MTATPAPTDRGERMSTPTPEGQYYVHSTAHPVVVGPGADVSHDEAIAALGALDNAYVQSPAASARRRDTADVIERARCVLAESYDGIDPDVETRHDGAVANLAAAGLLASPVPEVTIEQARGIAYRALADAPRTRPDGKRFGSIAGDRVRADAVIDAFAAAGLLAVATSPVAPVMQPTHIQAADELDRGAAQLADVADITQSRSAYGYGYRIAYERIVDWLRHEFVPPAPAPADDEAARCPSCEHTAAFHQPEGCWYTVVNGKPGRDLVCPCEVSRAALAAPKEGQR